MKRIYTFLFVTMAMMMLSVNSAWAQYVKVIAENGTESWIGIKGIINGENILIYELYKYQYQCVIDKSTTGSIDLNEVWSESGGSGTHYQVTSIGEKAFYLCSGLTSVIIPNSVTSIGSFAFANCSGLTSVTIGNGVTTIGEGAFSSCSGLTSIDIPNSVTTIMGSAFDYCSGLTSIEIPNSVTCIGSSAFLGCSGLTSVTIGNSVTNIGNMAFWGCTGLTSITIPNSVTSIGRYAFSHCFGLTSITSYITEVFVTESEAFSDCENVTLYVPRGMVNFYRITADWNRFKKIEELPGPETLVMSCNNKGKVLINETEEFTNDLGEVNINDGVDNTFIFQPNDNCELRQVLIDGLDVTLSVENNQLTTKVHEGSKMIVMFDKSGADVNGDGQLNISDVVALVNLILGQ